MAPLTDQGDRSSPLHAPRPRYHRHTSTHSQEQASRDHSQKVNEYLPRSYNHPQSRFSTPVSAPGTRPSSRSSSPVHNFYSYSSKRNSWPPSPSVEDERNSRAREAFPPAVMDPALSEVKVRGIPNQQPILLEAEASIDKISASKTQQLGQDGRPTGRGDAEETTYSRRRATPYAHTNVSRSDSESESKRRDSGYGSRDLKQPSSEETLPSNALRGTGKSRRSVSRGSNNVTETPKFAVNRTGDVGKPAATSSSVRFAADGQARGTANASGDKPAREPVPLAAKVKGQSLNHARRSTSDGVPPALMRPQLHLRKDSPLTGGGVIVDSADFVSSPTSTTFTSDLGALRKNSTSDSSRPATPDEKSQRLAHSPPHSPRSATSSRASSRPNSRSSSPQPPVQLPTRVHFKADDRTQRTSKLMSSMTPSTANLRDDAPRPTSRHDTLSPTRPGTSLPYPVDDMALMPSEEDHRYRPRALDTVLMPDAAPVAPAAGRQSVNARPTMPRTQSQGQTLPRLATGGIFAATAAASLSSPAVPTPTSAKLQPCPHSKPIKGFNDWYTLQDCPRFNICRSCVDANFAGTSSERHFCHASRSPEKRVQCDFASPWARLAGRLDKQRDRGDLRYLYAIASVMVAEVSCPGAHEDRMTWYTVADDEGKQLSRFNVCSTDLKMIRTLLPHTRDMFEKNHESAGRPRKCDLNVDSKRFASYLTSLTEVEHAYRAGDREHDQAKHCFYQKALGNTQVRECSGDKLTVDARWHFMPSLPDFTVCDECYSAVVWPQIANESRVALNFNRTPTRVHSRRSSASSTTSVQDMQSCQLYSERMRRQFAKACRENDFAWLERKAKERREVELEIHEERAALEAEEKTLKRQGHSERQLAGIRSRLAKLDADWQRWE